MRLRQESRIRLRLISIIVLFFIRDADFLPHLIHILLRFFDHLDSLVPLLLVNHFGLLNVFFLNCDPSVNFVFFLLIGSRRYLLARKQLFDRPFLLLLPEYQPLLPELNQLLILIVLHELDQFLARQVLESISIEKRIARLLRKRFD